MRVKEMLSSIKDRNLSLQERLFRLLVLLGLCGLAAGIIGDIAVGADMKNNLVLAALGVFVSVVFYLSLRFHKIQAGAVIIAVAIIFFALPFAFFVQGGIYGGGPIWLVFGVAYVSLVVVGKVKYVLLASGFVVNTVCYYIVYSYPSMYVQNTMEAAYVDSIVSLLIVSGLICSMIIFQKTIYRSESAIAKKQNREIEELNRAQNRFFSSMSHEIRTPINTIIGLNEMILREDISDEVAADAINIQGASKMLLSLINDFLDMSKIESGKMEIVPVTYEVGRMLSDIVNMIWVRAKEKGLEFHVDVDETVPAQLIGDEVRVKQILVNVLNNAVKYTDTGSVTLSIRSKEDSSEYAQISYSVTDTGMGIKQEDIEHLFSAFQRVDEEENRHIEGTGLGLSIVKQLVEMMGGNITVSSVYGKGSTFEITLPQKMIGEEKIGEFNLETRHHFGTREHYMQSFEAPRARILIVDDDETNLMVAEKLLRETKVQIDTVTSGEECLKKTLAERYDVIFMDHLMPGMDGIECLHAVRNQMGGLNPDAHVVVLTANAGGENQTLYRKEGFDGYLPKPVNGAQLEEELLKHLSKDVVRMRRADGSVGVVETPEPVRKKKKLPVMITAGSVCDLPEKFVEKYQITIMPYRILTDGGDFLDGIEMDADGALSYMSKGEKNIRSEEPEVEDMKDFFAEQLTKAEYIVHIAMTKYLSAGYERVLEASEAFDNVSVIDSGHFSCGMGLLVLRAAEYAARGMSANEIVRKIEEMKTQVRTSFIVDSTNYLARSGRLSSKVDRVCDALMLHPVLTVKKSKIKVGSVRVGTKEAVWKKYIASTLNSEGAIDADMLFIAHAGLSEDEIESIKEGVKKKVEFQRVVCQKASPVISANCGPGSFGLMFMIKE